MGIIFAIIAALTLVSGIAAMSLRKLIHCALCLAVTFAGLATMYLQLGAQFVGFAQVLVYVGAVAILVVFAILLTQSGVPEAQPVVSKSWVAGAGIAVMVFGVLTYAILTSSVAHRDLPVKPDPTVKDIGTQLMTWYILPLQVIGLLLTVATIGAVIIAMREPKKTASKVGQASSLSPNARKYDSDTGAVQSNGAALAVADRLEACPTLPDAAKAQT